MSERAKVSLSPAYLLHARPYLDASVIAEFLTQDHGRIALVARGARRPKSKIKSALAPFQPLLLSWVSRGSLGTLTAVELASRMTHSFGKQVLSAFYVNELVMRALKTGDSHPEVFVRYADLLSDLQSSGPHEATLRIFERDLLGMLGYGLQLSIDQHGARVNAASNYQYDLQDGPLLTSELGGTYVVLGATLCALQSGEFSSDEELKEAKGLLRYALDYHLGTRESKVRKVASTMMQHQKDWSE